MPLAGHNYEAVRMSSVCRAQLLLEEFGKYADGRQAFFTDIYNQVSHMSHSRSGT
jgi:hypothetical protein